MMFKHNDNLNFLIVVVSFLVVLYLLDLRREVRVSLCVKGTKVTYFGIDKIKPSTLTSSDKCVCKSMAKYQWYDLRDRTYQKVRERKNGR